MTLDEAVVVLDTLAAPYPWWTLDERAIDAWTDALARSGAGPEQALVVARSWGTREAKPPSLAHLLALVRPVPVAAPQDPDEALEIHPSVARRIRTVYAAKLRAIDERVAASPEKRGVEGHWHGGGVAGCPICGKSAA